MEDDHGDDIAIYRASSGMIGFMNPVYQGCPNKGPIPEGKYYFDPEDFEGPPLLNWFVPRDWGTWRVPLTPLPATETYIKSLNRTGGFWIHGGEVEGTAGCIDLGDKDVDFYNKMKTHGGLVPVIVDYPETR